MKSKSQVNSGIWRGPNYQISNLTKRWTGSGVRFELHIPHLVTEPGEIYIVTGPSGSGKSTLLDILALALKPDSADEFLFKMGYLYDDMLDARQLWRDGDQNRLGSIRGRYIGYVLQTGGLLPFLTARENIALVTRGTSTRDRIYDLAHRLSIASQLELWPTQLSIGERQRVAIARALVHQPQVVLADEPTASVDPINAEAIREVFLELVRRYGATAIIATHDWNQSSKDGFVFLNHRLEQYGHVTRSLFWN